MKNIKLLISYLSILLLALIVTFPLFVSGAENNGQPASSLTGFPMVGTAEAQQYDLVFAVAGDSRSDHGWLDTKKNPQYSKYINVDALSTLRDILIDIWKGSPGFFLMHVGDIGIRGGTPIFNVFELLMASMHAPNVNMPVYLAKGNHEVRYYIPEKDGSDPGHAEHPDKAILAQREYQQKFVNSWMMPKDAVSPNIHNEGLAYYFIRGSSLFIVLDSYYVDTGATGYVYRKGYYSDFQLQWLQDILKLYNSIPNKFVFSHQPVFNAAGGNGSLYTRYDEIEDNRHHESARSNWILWRLLDIYSVDAYFCGHSHFYHRWNIVGSKFQYKWDTSWAALGTGFSDLQRYIDTPTPWQYEIPQVINGTCGAPLDGFKHEYIPCEKRENVFNFSIVKVKGDAITVDVYSYDTQKYPKLIDKLQKQNGQWKNIPIPAMWLNDTALNLPLAVSPGNQQRPRIVRDASGNIFTGWLDYHARKVHVQKMDASGNILWQANGIPASPVILQSLADFEMEVDGQGGVYVTWNCSQMDLNSNETLETAENFNTNRLYAQRLNAQGQKQWASPVRVNDINHSIKKHSMTTDGQNGIIVHWISDYPQERPGAGDPQVLSVCVQRINPAGALLWGNYGIQVFEPLDPGGQAYGSISEYHALTTPDGAGGAFLGFNFSRSGELAPTRYLEAIRINGNGQRTKGIVSSEGTRCGLNPASQQTHTPGDVSAIPSGDGGVIYAWQTNYYHKAISSAHIYAQKVNADCSVVWPLQNGVPVCTAGGGQGKFSDDYPDGLDLTTDGSGGAIIAWIDMRPNDYFRLNQVFAQRINNLGNAVWINNGIGVAKLPCPYVSEPRVLSDNAGGAIVSFSDGVGIRAQRLSASGSQIWAEDKALDTHSISPVRFKYHETVMHENGSLVAVWQDHRNDVNNDITNLDIYTQFISRDASLVPTYTLTLGKNGNGTVDPPLPEPRPLPAGTLVNIKATPAYGNKFVNWSGGAVDNPTAAQTTVFIDANKTVTANFTLPLTMMPIPGVSGPGLWVMAGLFILAAFLLLRRMRPKKN